MPTIVQTVTATTSPFTIAAPANGNLLLLFYTDTATQVSAISGGGVTWTLENQFAAQFAETIAWGFPTSAGGTSITVTGGTAKSMTFLEIGSVNSVAIDTPGDTTNTGTSTSATSTAFNTAQANEMVFVLLSNDTGGNPHGSPTNGYTNVGGTTNSFGSGQPAYHFFTATQTGTTTGWTLNASVGWDVITIGLKYTPPSTAAFDEDYDLTIPTVTPQLTLYAG
jgi:hypothetical protein